MQFSLFILFKNDNIHIKKKQKHTKTIALQHKDSESQWKDVALTSNNIFVSRCCTYLGGRAT